MDNIANAFSLKALTHLKQKEHPVNIFHRMFPIDYIHTLLSLFSKRFVSDQMDDTPYFTATLGYLLTSAHSHISAHPDYKTRQEVYDLFLQRTCYDGLLITAFKELPTNPTGELLLWQKDSDFRSLLPEGKYYFLKTVTRLEKPAFSLYSLADGFYLPLPGNIGYLQFFDPDILYCVYGPMTAAEFYEVG